ncbi:MAG TPA: bacillithiol system redox-active protein YtxJ [Edaphocola sp.]|nr:bacillithiol system redox-active protein YtxJ [Edaphocola sp.]
MNWTEINDMNQLETIKKASFENPQIIFKHSTRCNVSADAFRRMEQSDLSAWYLDLLAHRDLSNQIAKDYEVTHKSPQVIIIKDGKAVYNESHWRIKPEIIKEHLR